LFEFKHRRARGKPWQTLAKVSLIAETTTHADSLLHGIPEASIEGDNSSVGCPNLKINFWTTEALQFSFSSPDEPGCNASATVAIGNGQMVKPTPNAIKSSHQCTNDACV
jgi:hypothetical protein